MENIGNREIGTDGERINYVFLGNVYPCVYYEGNIWIGIKLMANGRGRKVIYRYSRRIASKGNAFAGKYVQILFLRRKWAEL